MHNTPVCLAVDGHFGGENVQCFMLSCLLLLRITQKLHNRTLPNFCACFLRPWLAPHRSALRYVMYFRFCGWRRIFLSWGQWATVKHYVIVNSSLSVRQLQCLVEFIRMRHPGWCLLSCLRLTWFYLLCSSCAAILAKQRFLWSVLKLLTVVKAI